MVNHVGWSGNGFKSFTLHNNKLGSCAALELTITNSEWHGFPVLYTECGPPLQYGLPGGDVVNQWGNVYPPGSAGSPIYCLYSMIGNPANKCVYYEADKWITWYLHVQIGTFGQPNSVVEAWAGYDSTPLEWTNHHAFTFRIDSSPTETGFDTMSLTPYITGATSAPHTTGYTWYDDLIMSTQPILWPGNGGSSNPPPAVPQNLRVQ